MADIEKYLRKIDSKGILAAEPPVPRLSDIRAVRQAIGVVDTATDLAAAAVKITLGEIGLAKIMLSRKVNTPKIGETSRYEPVPGSYASTGFVERINPKQYYCFRCGDFWLPISTTYEVMASKNTAISQLVDGVEVIQKINNNPKIISMNIRICRNQEKEGIAAGTGTGNSGNMAFIANDTAMEDTGGIAPVGMYSVVGLGKALAELYERQDVFYIENEAINSDFGVQWVFMESFNFMTNAGSTVVSIDMVLHEVNMEENAVVFTSHDTVDPDVSAGGGAR